MIYLYLKNSHFLISISKFVVSSDISRPDRVPIWVHKAAHLFQKNSNKMRFIIFIQNLVISVTGFQKGYYLKKRHGTIPKFTNSCKIVLNLLSANFTKSSNTLKQFVGKLPTNCSSVFDHFVGLGLKIFPMTDLLIY